MTDWIAKKLSRITSSVEYIPEIDGLRFLAIIPVLALHATYYMLYHRGVALEGWERHNGLIVQVISTGAIGVQMFFVLSGFIVSLPFARHSLREVPAPKLGRYYLRRLTRIEPPYILALTAMFLLAGYHRHLLPDYLAGLFYLHQIVFGTFNPINIPNWSLEVEVCFYLVAPLLVWVYRIRKISLERRLFQLALMLLSSYFVYELLIPMGPPRLNYTLVTELPFFLAGILLADLYATGRLRRASLFFWDVAAVVCLSGLVYAEGWEWRLQWLKPLMIMVIVVAAFCGRVANWFFRQRLVTIVGGMCYTLYLWHMVLIMSTSKHLVPLIPASWSQATASLLFCFLMIPALIAMSAPLYYFLEKPFMSRFRETAAALQPDMMRRAGGG